MKTQVKIPFKCPYCNESCRDVDSLTSTLDKDCTECENSKLATKRIKLNVGTKSILFGAHCFLLHPVFVAIAWIKFYGWTWDPRIWIAFFVHDLGYWGKPNMDGPEGEKHPELGARIMHLFDRWDYKDITYSYFDPVLRQQEINFKKEEGWIVVDIIDMDMCSNILYKKRSYMWHDFALYHSRFYAKKKGAKPSKLCMADKYAFVITPQWLYLPMAKATGEIIEYIDNELNRPILNRYITPSTKRIIIQIWHSNAILYTIQWIREHCDGKEDTWTDSNRNQEIDKRNELSDNCI